MAIHFSLFIILFIIIFGQCSKGATLQQYEFNVAYTNVSRLCHSKSMVVVNGQFPGPTITVHEGDEVVVKVNNKLPDKNITIHWHGVRQLLTGWYDGPGYITQCPIRPGQSFRYDFTVSGQRGTLFWHAHISWLRATVYGALIILPKALGAPLYPFITPWQEVPIILGEWWNADTEAVINQALQSGAGPNVSDALTVNGQPGFLYNCSIQDTFSFSVQASKTYLLRIINAGINEELFFGIASHKLTVVEIDASYTKPLQTDSILLAPGQTASVLLTANQPATSRYIMAARAYSSSSNPFDNTTTTGFLDYTFAGNSSTAPSSTPTSNMPPLPAFNDTAFAINFNKNLRALGSSEFPSKVPQSVDRELFYTVGLARKECPTGKNCTGPSGGKFAAAVNNISFSLPTTALLQAFFLNNANGDSSTVFPTDFPDNPIPVFNYTGPQPKNLKPQIGTHLSHLPFNASVQLLLQDTSILGTESHPIHLHGFNFFVVGQGVGNYNASSDTANFNLVDPLERNTVSVPKGGWAALRFRSDNPGVWFLHCHLEIHTSWGLETAFLVPNGVGPDQSLIPPPVDLPLC